MRERENDLRNRNLKSGNISNNNDKNQDNVNKDDNKKNGNVYISAKDISNPTSNSRNRLNKSNDRNKRPFEQPVIVAKKRNYNTLKKQKSDNNNQTILPVEVEAI